MTSVEVLIRPGARRIVLLLHQCNVHVFVYKPSLPVGTKEAAVPFGVLCCLE